MIALDIGAGNTSFWRNLKRLNPQIDTIFCGDPYMKIGFFRSIFERILNKEEVQGIMQESRKGVFRTLASYGDTWLSDESVDIVALNSPLPFTTPKEKDFDGFQRILKKWGIFYFGHSTDICHEFKEEKMVLVGEWWFSRNSQQAILHEQDIVFPMSPIIRSNMITKHLQERWHRLSVPAYSTGIPLNPSWKAWVKK